ncbi:HWE histidine kinase domain-containing protein [Sphingomonas sp. AOB5]|uniref:sensor histidine kinase n=1 Tax=Sphingomonas sp. AOB5 TaxID=3034017 RepID=UPI0023F72EFC|nr:HWE histidine kinase domain-containing protein [Sphingomonas sp. AOB5]MDF7776563.1 HWE histidine kinase domain-containing protein [Sphingomonas sp. AOB5]
MTDQELARRLDALADLAILDTAPEQGFDDIVELASHICRTPVALVSLVDRDRQWFKAGVGVDMCETPISQSVCRHGMGSTEMLIIPDLTMDPRTAANTLVTEPPHIRFYAGAPLVTAEGVTIGMLCVIDLEPRPEGLTDEQAKMLRALSRQVIAQLELRSALRAADEHESRLRAAQEAGGIGTFELDVASNVMTVSPEFCRLFGVPIAETYGTAEIEALVDTSDGTVHSTTRTRADGSAEVTVEYRLLPREGVPARWISRRAEFVRDEDGNVTHMRGIVGDVTERRLVNDEIGHRMKNTLSLVQAIAAHTLRVIPDREPVIEFDRRLLALAASHDVLLRSGTAAPMRSAAVAALTNLTAQDRVSLEGPEVELNSQATLFFSMLVHELATNALKYGALSVPGGRVGVTWRIEGEDLVLDWHERGGPPVTQPTRKGFGSRLIERGLGGAGAVKMDYLPTGLEATLRTPLDQIR